MRSLLDERNRIVDSLLFIFWWHRRRPRRVTIDPAGSVTLTGKTFLGIFLS